MDIQFNTSNAISGTEDLAAKITGHLQDRLGRFEDRLTRLEVHITDANGPKGGSDDITCKIEARPRGGDPVNVTAQSNEVESAARQASNKMVSLLDSHFGKADRRH